jgi:hypothetical protein
MFFNLSAPKIGNGLLKSNHDRGAFEIFRPFSDYMAFELSLVYFVDEQEPLATPHWRGQSDKSAAGIHTQRFGAFVKRFTFDCSSINEHRKIDPEAATLAAFRLMTAAFVRRVIGSAHQSVRLRFLQKVPNPAHKLASFAQPLILFDCNSSVSETFLPSGALLNGCLRHGDYIKFR